MDWSVAKIGTIYQEPAQAIGLSTPPTPPIGCVLDLPGLPGGGNKIYDRSPYGNHGTITGAVWKRLPSGLWYLDFDGTDDYVDVSNHSVFNFGTGDFSVGLWINWDIGGEGAGAQDCLGGNAGNFLIHKAATELIHLSDGTSWPQFGISVAFGEWEQYFAARQGQTFHTYCNGVAITSFGGSWDVNFAVNPLYIGKAEGYLRYFKGLIALPRLYNRALSALEINNHFNREKHLFGVV